MLGRLTAAARRRFLHLPSECRVGCGWCAGSVLDLGGRGRPPHRVLVGASAVAAVLASGLMVPLLGEPPSWREQAFDLAAELAATDHTESVAPAAELAARLPELDYGPAVQWSARQPPPGDSDDDRDSDRPGTTADVALGDGPGEEDAGEQDESSVADAEQPTDPGQPAENTQRENSRDPVPEGSSPGPEQCDYTTGTDAAAGEPAPRADPGPGEDAGWQSTARELAQSLAEVDDPAGRELAQVLAEAGFGTGGGAETRPSERTGDPGRDEEQSSAAEGGRAYFDEADWLWNPIPDDPRLDPQSKAMVGHLATGDHIANTGDFGVTLRGTDDITEDTPRYPVSFSQEGSWGPDPFAGETIPVPENTPIAPGSDGHLAIADPISNMVYNLWMAQDGGDSWSAGWGAMTPLDGDGREENGSSTGAGIARYAAVVRAEEIAAGEIPHALFFSTNMAAPDEVRYPATKTDGSNMDGVETPIPEGARVQLDPSLDLDSLRLSEGEFTVARALQTYGAYVGDNGGARMAFLFEYVPDSSVYSDAGLEGDYAPLEGIPWDRLRVLSDWTGGTGEPGAQDDRSDEREGRDGDENQDGDSPRDETVGTADGSDRPEEVEVSASTTPEPEDDRAERDDRSDPTPSDPSSAPGDGSASEVPGGPDGCAAAFDDLGYAEGTGEVLPVGAADEYSSIQAAVDAAGPGDIVEITEAPTTGSPSTPRARPRNGSPSEPRRTPRSSSKAAQAATRAWSTSTAPPTSR